MNDTDNKQMTVEQKRVEVVERHKVLQVKRGKLGAKIEGLVATMADFHRQMQAVDAEINALSGQFVVLNAIHLANEKAKEAIQPLEDKPVIALVEH